jgi:hypothetical protein
VTIVQEPHAKRYLSQQEIFFPQRDISSPQKKYLFHGICDEDTGKPCANIIDRDVVCPCYGSIAQNTSNAIDAICRNGLGAWPTGRLKAMGRSRLKPRVILGT